jgi:hypothetical protein
MAIHSFSRRWFATKLVMVIAGPLLLAGCSNEPRQYRVQGTVKFQGQPVADGQIMLHADDSNDVGIGKISGGVYELKCTAGPKTVRITATQETGRMLEGGMGDKVPEKVEIIPPKYNTASNEKRTIEPRDGQSLDFDLP